MRKCLLVIMLVLVAIALCGCGNEEIPQLQLSDPNEKIIMENILVEGIEVETVEVETWDNARITRWD